MRFHFNLKTLVLLIDLKYDIIIENGFIRLWSLLITINDGKVWTLMLLGNLRVRFIKLWGTIFYSSMSPPYRIMKV